MQRKQRIVLKSFTLVFFSIVFLAILFLDRFSKLAIINWYSGHPLPVLPWVEFILVKNQGIAFGLFSESNLNFILISLLSLIILCIIFFYFLPIFPLWPFVLISAGAIGNIIDRILYGYVVDFIKIHSFYVFNVADASITIGSILLIYMLLFEKKPSHEVSS